VRPARLAWYVNALAVHNSDSESCYKGSCRCRENVREVLEKFRLEVVPR
jgi:hypothetical protein